jgi:glutaredoxin-related protein
VWRLPEISTDIGASDLRSGRSEGIGCMADGASASAAPAAWRAETRGIARRAAFARRRSGIRGSTGATRDPRATWAARVASDPAMTTSSGYPAVDMTSRPLFDPASVDGPALEKMTSFHADTITEIADALRAHDVVVVGMAQNPHVKNVRKALDEAGVAFHYLEYGSYLSEWKKRLAIKLWSGWPTFPQVFVKGKLLGGEDLTKAAIADGTLKQRLAQKI